VTRVLVLCTGNSARSQMAEGLLRAMAPGVEVHSAGTAPAARVHPAAVEAMAELGIDISSHRPKTVDTFLAERFDVVITVCDHARDTCPVFAGEVGARLHMGCPDPAAVTGAPADVLDAFRRVRDELRDRLGAWARGRDLC
jgi:arsenate reductase